MIPTRDIRFRGRLVGQTPNGPMLAAICAVGLENAVDDGSLKRAARLSHFAALAIWGWLEATRGANVFRRLVGVAAIAVIAARLYDEGF